jgi:hypothetical protein
MYILRKDIKKYDEIPSNIKEVSDVHQDIDDHKKLPTIALEYTKLLYIKN